MLSYTPCIIPGMENIRKKRLIIFFKKVVKLKQLILLFLLLIAKTVITQPVLYTEVLVVGGGTGGTAAGIQCARMGVKTIIMEEGPWLGGMLSAAGVSATDGNHNLPSGIWNEFRNAIYKVYGGAEKVATGWISNTHFEPGVADSIFKSMAAKEKKLSVYYHHLFSAIIKKGKQVVGANFINTKTKNKITVYAKQVIEATELGDVIASAAIPFNIGMESGNETGENVGVKETNDIIQDLTYVAILKNYGNGTDKTIPQPANYSPQEFDGACTNYYINKSIIAPTVDAQKMLDYAKLPNGKYMINWPGRGNDIYLTIISLTPAQREKELEKAKQQTLRFVYFIQTQLGFKNLGLTEDEFGTKDKLALMPYYRESRRVKGITRFTINHIAKPFDYNYYRTGISVGDYPIDHHHKKNPAAPQHLEFYPIPSYNIPLGSLIPESTDGLIVCDKSISVSNVVNGTTRLQPVVLLTGQAAGTLAALCIINKKQPREINIRNIQEQLVKSGTLIMPYRDAGISHPFFSSIQRIGATGILKGTGIPFKWANQTWFYPDSAVVTAILIEDLRPFIEVSDLQNQYIRIKDAIKIISLIGSRHKGKLRNMSLTFADVEKLNNQIRNNWNKWGLKNFSEQRNITRAEFSVLLDKSIDPFQLKQVDHKGNFNN